LDVEWDLPDGRRIIAEIDGAAHIEIDEWVPDQLRQNEVVIDGALVLRFPSVVVRHDPEIVVGQLRRALTPLGCRG
jgi:very-short-patch-repair endonuclease